LLEDAIFLDLICQKSKEGFGGFFNSKIMNRSIGINVDFIVNLEIDWIGQ